MKHVELVGRADFDPFSANLRRAEGVTPYIPVCWTQLFLSCVTPGFIYSFTCADSLILIY